MSLESNGLLWIDFPMTLLRTMCGLKLSYCKGRRRHVYTVSFLSYFAVFFQLYLGQHHSRDIGPVYIAHVSHFGGI
jgi:hypothetical protein